MRRTSTRGAAALALGLLGGALATLAGGGRPAAAVTLIQTCGFTATLPGTYVLARDLLTCSGRVITVAANNVNLVLAGHTLTAAPDGAGGVIAENVTGLKITGGAIVGFSIGIELDNTPDARVTGVTATGNHSVGIFVSRTTGARLSGNTVTNNGTAGIRLSSTTGAQLAGNTATNNRVGITLVFDSDGNRVVGNTVTGNGSFGIQVQPSSTGNQFRGNTATGNSPDLGDDNPPPCANNWHGNTFATKGGAGAACIQ
jgi:parallel beta-helix repeat protein